MKLRTLALGSAASMALLCGGAFAADLPVRSAAPAPVVMAPVFTWTGFYVGANIGYGWADSDASVTNLPTQAGFGADPYRFTNESDGVLGGVQIGYNWQTGRFVLGLELDAQLADISGRTSVGPLAAFGGAPIAGSFGVANTQMDSFFTARLRVGVALDRILIYATGGLAGANIDYTARSQYSPGDAFNYVGANGDFLIGWTLGAGVEYAFSNNWSAKLEYLYYQLDDKSFVGNPVAPNAPFQTSNRIETDGQLVRVGINYRFGGGYSAPVVARY